MSLGFLRAGFEIIHAVDHWKPAVDSYRVNIGDHVTQGEIQLDCKLPQPAIMVGGPPCQGFSSAGQRRNDDKRNSLVTVFARLIAQYKPAAFVFENVEGFLTGVQGKFIFQLLEPVIEAGYRVHLRKVNAANYGVPQHRKRVVAIGGLGWEPSFPKPTHAAFGAPGAQLGNGYRTLPTPTISDALSVLRPRSSEPTTGINDHCVTPLKGDDLRRAEMLKPGQRMRDLPEELWHESYRRRAFRRVMDGTPTEKRGGAPAGLRRLHGDEPCKAITGGALRDFLHPTEDRLLTIRECAVLQTFPLEFQFVGNQSEKIQLIGNAVPPLLAEAIAVNLRNDLQQASISSEGPGVLLSFIPTLSTGMSPILEDVTRRVNTRFRNAPARTRQTLLWD
jgi:DNA (cytosine-5)-methyltransferase 1